MAKFKLTEWAHIAEIIGAIAIVISLIYVGFQIDQNTDEIRAASVQSIVERDLQITLLMATDPVLRSAISKLIANSENEVITISGNENDLNNEELQAMRQILLAMLRVLEEAYTNYQLGYLSDDFMQSRIVTVINLFGSQQMNAMYLSQKNLGIYSDEFTDWLDLQIEKN